MDKKLVSVETPSVSKNHVDTNQGVGSIWNKGNWHWEDRNYSEFAKEYLTKQFTTITETTADAKILIYEVKTLTGHASVTIRKQK